MTNVLIVEDERLAGELLAHYIESRPETYHLVGSIRTAADALAVCYARQVDLILMDVCTANNSSGLAAAKEIKEKLPEIKIIIVTSMPEYRFLQLAREAGAESFWYKDVSEEELLTVMDRTMAGESIYPQSTPEVEIGEVTSSELSEREKELLYWLVKVGNTTEIAENMNITLETARTYIKRLQGKTGCKSKTELALMAVEKRYVLPKY